MDKIFEENQEYQKSEALIIKESKKYEMPNVRENHAKLKEKDKLASCGIGSMPFHMYEEFSECLEQIRDLCKIKIENTEHLNLKNRIKELEEESKTKNEVIKNLMALIKIKEDKII